MFRHRIMCANYKKRKMIVKFGNGEDLDSE